MGIKVPTAALKVRIPTTWAVEIAALAAEESEKKQRLITVQDKIRVAILKTYFLLKNEMMPEFKTYKPLRLVQLPELPKEFASVIDTKHLAGK